MKKNNLSFFAFCIVCLFVIKTNAQVVSTIAGSGSVGSNDASGASATFNTPVGVCTDAIGNVFVADYNNNKIRKITPTGVVTTFAGSGVPGGTNATGTAASFSKPMFICADASDNLYVTEYFNHRIRKITPAGVVTTFAGSGIQGSANGTGTAATFHSPSGICADPLGNIYVAEAGSNKVRKITPAGVVTTYASGFLGPNGMCFDASGNLYVAGGINNKIQKVTPAGVVSTFAGSGTAGSTNGTGTSATFNNPLSIAIDASGNLYMSEGAGLIRKITTAAVVTTYAGTGAVGSMDGPLLSATFNDPEGLCIDIFGNMYIGDTGNHKIRLIGAPCSAPLPPTNTTPLNNQTLCENNTTILSSTTTGTVNWYATPTETTVLASGTSYTTSALSAGIYTFYAEASTCTVSATRTAITVTVNSAPTILVNSGVICSGNSFTINPSGANTYTYSGGSAIVTPTGSVSYSVTGTSTEGCVSSNAAISSVTVNITPTITVNSAAICSGESFTISPTGANTYTISGGSAIVTPTSTSSYSVTGTSFEGCVSFDIAVSSVTVNVLPSITAVTNNLLLCVGETATLTANGASTYTWSTNDNTNEIVISPTVTTSYTVTGTDGNGCLNNTTVTQDVSLCTGVNTITRPHGIAIYPNPNNGLFTVELNETSAVIITNALGQLIFNEMISGKQIIDLQNADKGVYFVKITRYNKQTILKLILQ